MKVGIYTRVSRPSEATILNNQLHDAKVYCENRGYDYTDRVWYDVASGGNQERNGWNEMMAVVRRGEVKIIVFTSPSRMTRAGVGTAFGLLKDFERAGVGWHFVNFPVLNYDDTAPKMLKDIMLAFLAAFDEEFRRNISEKTKQAFARRTKPWGHPKGTPMSRCDICGQSPHSKVHMAKYHAYQEIVLEERPRCKVCDLSKGAGPHIASRHDFTRAPKNFTQIILADTLGADVK